jgi:hypothetical protein
MLSITLSMDRRAQPSTRPVLNWKKGNWPPMREDLAAADWTAVRTESVEKMWDFFRARVREAVD